MQLVSITNARTRLPEIVREAAESPVHLMRHSRPVAVVLSARHYEALLDEIEDLRDELSIWESHNSPADLRIPLEKLEVELGLK